MSCREGQNKIVFAHKKEILYFCRSIFEDFVIRKR